MKSKMIYHENLEDRLRKADTLSCVSITRCQVSVLHPAVMISV